MDGFWQKAGQMMGKVCGYAEEDFKNRLRDYSDAQVLHMHNNVKNDDTTSPKVKMYIAEEMRRRGL